MGGLREATVKKLKGARLRTPFRFNVEVQAIGRGPPSLSAAYNGSGDPGCRDLRSTPLPSRAVHVARRWGVPRSPQPVFEVAHLSSYGDLGLHFTAL